MVETVAVKIEYPCGLGSPLLWCVMWCLSALQLDKKTQTCHWICFAQSFATVRGAQWLTVWTAADDARTEMEHMCMWRAV